MRFFIVKILVIICCIILFNGCTAVHSQKWKNRKSASDDIFFIDAPVDIKLDFQTALTKAFTKAGLKTTHNKNRSTIVVNFNRYCYFDVYHYVCRNIEAILRDSNTGDIFCAFSYSADTLLSYKGQTKNFAEGMKNECYQ